MRIFQPDGNEVEMCGNGSPLSWTLYPHPSSHTHNFLCRYHALCSAITVDGSHVTIEMPKPTNLRIDDEFTDRREKYNAPYYQHRSPHAVIFVEEIEMCDILELGRKIRHDPAFAPYGTNVNFVKVTRRHH